MKTEKKIEKIVTHVRPHLDEITAIWLLQKFGEEKFPDVSNAEIIFWGVGGEDPEGLSAQDFEDFGVILIGIGGGRFDEHPTFNRERKENECAATLVAKELGISENPALERILKFVLNKDTKGAGHPFDLGSIVDTLYREYPDHPEEVINWAVIGLEAKHQEQLEFLTVTREEFEQNAEIVEILGPDGKTVKMVAVVSGNVLMNKFARSVHGCNAAIVIQQQPSGNVQIYTDKQQGLTLYDVVQMIRLAEQKAKGEVVTTEWKELASEGKVKGVEEWFFIKPSQMLLNGSLTATEVPATQLTLEQIKEIVKIGINPDAFEPEHAPTCSQGICNASKDNSCPWYPWGLHRCRKLRFKMKQPN